MRHVAVAFVLILLAAAMPASADRLGPYDECDSLNAAAAQPCARVEVPSGNGVPATPVKRHYLWAAAAKCAPAFDSTCSGRPAQDAVAGFLGVVYEETNGLAGLQRTVRAIGEKTYVADHMVLV